MLLFSKLFKYSLYQLVPMSWGTISDWIKEGNKRGIEKSVKEFHTEKSEDDKRLIRSGLPCFDRFEVPYSHFSEQNKTLMKFLSKYSEFVIRALPIPKESNLPRRPKIGVKSLEECLDFLQELFSTDEALIGKEQLYKISLVERKPTKGAGIIFSTPKKVIAELGYCGLDELSHGHNPVASFVIDFSRVGHLENKTIWLKEGNNKDRILMWNALRYLELSRDSFNPHYMRGYFEFLVLKDNRVVFWDYKVNEMYLK